MHWTLLFLNLIDSTSESLKEQGMGYYEGMNLQVSLFHAEVIGTIFFSIVVILRNQTVPSFWPWSLGLGPQSSELGVSSNGAFIRPYNKSFVKLLEI